MTVDGVVESRVGGILVGVRMMWLVLVSKKLKKWYSMTFNVNVSTLYGHSLVIREV